MPRPRIRWFLALVALLLPLAVAAPVRAATSLNYLGEEAFRTYCKSQGAQDVTLVNQTAYGIRCLSSSGQTTGMDVTNVCRQAFPNIPPTHMHAWFEDFEWSTNPYGWQCSELLHGPRVPGKAYGYQGPPHLTDVCRREFGGDHVYVDPGNKTVGGWRCAGGNFIPPNSAHIQARDACNWTYNPEFTNDNSVPSFNYNNPYSIRCYR